MTEEGAKRKLSAIFSADVKGYSRLMGEDEIVKRLPFRSIILLSINLFRHNTIG